MKRGFLIAALLIGGLLLGSNEAQAQSCRRGGHLRAYAPRTVVVVQTPPVRAYRGHGHYRHHHHGRAYSKHRQYRYNNYSYNRGDQRGQGGTYGPRRR